MKKKRYLSYFAITISLLSLIYITACTFSLDTISDSTNIAQVDTYHNPSIPEEIIKENVQSESIEEVHEPLSLLKLADGIMISANNEAAYFIHDIPNEYQPADVKENNYLFHLQ